jgi:hypothetical protein
MRRNRILLGFSESPFSTTLETVQPSPAQIPRQCARLNILRASFLNAALPLDLPNQRGATRFAICSKLSFG